MTVRDLPNGGNGLLRVRHRARKSDTVPNIATTERENAKQIQERLLGLPLPHFPYPPTNEPRKVAN